MYKGCEYIVNTEREREIGTGTLVVPKTVCRRGQKNKRGRKRLSHTYPPATTMGIHAELRR